MTPLQPTALPPPSEALVSERWSSAVQRLYDATASSLPSLPPSLAAFSLSPMASPPSSPPPCPPPSSAADAEVEWLTSALLAAESPSTALPAVLSPLLHLLPLPSTASSPQFRLSVVEVLSRLLLAEHSPYPGLLATHLYRLVSLLLPSSSFEPRVADKASALLTSLLPLRVVPRAAVSNALKLVEGHREAGEKKLRARRSGSREVAQSEAHAPMAIFAEGGEADGGAQLPPPSLADEPPTEPWEGKRRKRIAFEEPSAAAQCPPLLSSAEDERRSVQLIEAIRAEQKRAQAEARLRADGEDDEAEWRREWGEGERDGEEVGGEEGREERVRAAFWLRWREDCEWTPFLPSSFASEPPSPATTTRRLERHRRMEAEAEEERVEAQGRLPPSFPPASRLPSGFKSTFLVAPPPPHPPLQSPALFAPQAPPRFSHHFVHPSRMPVSGPPAAPSMAQAPMPGATRGFWGYAGRGGRGGGARAVARPHGFSAPPLPAR